MRLAMLALSLLLAVALAAPAAARDRGGDGLSGVGELALKDDARGTLRIQGRTYHVTDRTRIVDRDGKLISLAQLDVPEKGDKGLFEILSGRYEAIERGNKLMLIRLELVDNPE